jgi:nucleoside-diphosphate-sugar epimerase
VIYLVTGAAGFVGSSLVDKLLEEGQRVVGVDCFRDYYDPAIKRNNILSASQKPDFTLLERDLSASDLSWLDEAIPSSGKLIIYHLAAQAGVRKSWGEHFSIYMNDNILATQRLLDWSLRRGNIQNFIFASSSSVYGEVRTLPLHEESTVPRPYSPYGVTKLAAEQLTRLYSGNFGLPSVSLRFFTVYGPRQRPDMAFHKFIQSVLKAEPIEVYGDGSQSRDFTYIVDIVQGLRLAESSTKGCVYNLGGGNRMRLLDVIDILEDAAGEKVEIDFQPAQSGDVRDTMASIELAERELGWKPVTPMLEGLLKEVAWIKEHIIT